MTSLHEVPARLEQELWNLVSELFPVYRSILGPGYRASLDIIAKELPLNVLEYPSGTKCGSWTVPLEWDVREAYVADRAGRRVIDYADNAFHLCQYSRPFRGTLSRDELLEHVRAHATDGGAIPLDVAFYRNYWGFCVSCQQLEELVDSEYDVVVDTRLHEGALAVGECFLPGESDKEILLDAALSCPSLANNISGVAVAVMVMKLLSSRERRRWSYRLLLTPETIGPIAVHHRSADRLRNVVGGYVLVNLGDRSDTFHYRASRPGNTIADDAMAHSLRHMGVPYEVEQYDVRTGTCGNEKAYNSLGIDVPVGSIRRLHLGSYPEYDTSKDDLSFIARESLFESFRVVWGAVEALERTAKWMHKFEGEPFLTGYGLYPNIESERDRLPWDYMMGFADGHLSLVEIADRAGLAVTEFDEPVRLMRAHGLIQETGPTVRGGR